MKEFLAKLLSNKLSDSTIEYIEYDPIKFTDGNPFFNPKDDLPPRCNKCGSNKLKFFIKRGKRHWICIDKNHRSSAPAKYNPSEPNKYSTVWYFLAGGRRVLNRLIKQETTSRRFTTEESVFISYKSEDVHLSRQIAEHLMSKGYKTWFAEYEILIDDLQKIDEKIDQGLRSCNKAVIVIGPKYFESPYCKREYEYLTSALPKNKVMLIFTNPTFVNKYNVSGFNYIVWKCHFNLFVKDLKNFGFIHNNELEQLKVYHAPKFSHGRVVFPGINVSFDLSEWARFDYLPKAKFPTWGFVREVGDEAIMLHFLLQDAGTKSRPGYTDSATLEDRTVFEQNLDVAKAYFNKIQKPGFNVYESGVHLVFAAGFSHLAITEDLVQKCDWVKNVWYHTFVRKYILTFPHIKEGIDMDLIVTCGMAKPQRNGRSENRIKFDGYLVHFLPYFEDVIKSAEISII